MYESNDTQDLGRADDEREIQLAVTTALQSAADYADEELSPERVKAQDYYHGEPFGDEEEGRSQIVSRDVADTVRAIMPSLMRVFFGAERVVEFVPEGPEDVAMAEQATDYVNYVFTRDNPGFNTLHAAMKDGLIGGLGVIKTWYDDSQEVSFESYEGLDDATLSVLEQDEELAIVEQESYPDEIATEMVMAQHAAAMAEIEALQAQGQEIPPEMMPRLPEVMPQLHNVTVRRTRARGRVRVEAVPPEEILISRGARSFHDASLVAHRTEKTVSELVAMGYDEDELEEAGSSDGLRTNDERLARDPSDYDVNQDEDYNRALRRVLYTEAWMPLDVDGDGIAELRKVCCLGDEYRVVRNDPASYVPLADFCPDPEPHQAIGKGVSAAVMDIQRIKSAVLRNTLDSLAQSIHPRTAVVEGEANMDDVLNNEVGGVIRMRRQGAVQSFAQPFVGQQAFPMIEYMDRLKEKRTGITDATQGLSAESMQSTTRAAVTATVEAAQQQIELIARIFTETGIRRLYKNLLRLVVQHQDKPRMVRLRNQWVQMDPRGWNAGMDVAISAALGAGTTETKMAMLMGIAEKQENILREIGLNNPLVTVGQYSNTLAQMVRLAGFKDSAAYFNELPPDFVPPEPPPEEQQQQADPAMLLAEVQREEIQANIQKKQAELELDRQKAEFELQMRREEMLRRDDRERDRLEADTILRAAKEGVDPGPILELMRRNRQLEQQGYFQ